MKPIFTRNAVCRISLFFLLLLTNRNGYGQACTPTITTGGAYILYLRFDNLYTGNTDATFTTSNDGYTSNATPVTSVKRDCSVGVYFNVNNQGVSADCFFYMYADLNNDGDFIDGNELVSINGTYGPLTTGGTWATGFNFAIPANYSGSTLRIRMAARAITAPTACGSYVGEVEDYVITINNNTAPTVNNVASPLLNTISEGNTTNDGMLISQIITSLKPETTLISDLDDCQLKGMALIGTTATNGSWEFRLGTGAWTSVGSVSDANALLLYSDRGIQETRLRFLPSGSGATGTFTFRAWDRSLGTNGTYYNITSNGGTTAFSTLTETVGSSVIATSELAGTANIYLPTYNSDLLRFNIIGGKVNRTTAAMTDGGFITTDGAEGFGYDADIDYTNNKLVWTGGSSYVSLKRSNLDGSNVESLHDDLSYPVGVAVGTNKIFVTDAGLGLIYSMDLDGSNRVAITGGTGQGTVLNVGDIEYRSGKIYYWNQASLSPAGDFFIMRANEDGTGTTQLYSTPNTINGISLSSTSIYWTEMLPGLPTSYVKKMPIGGGTVTTLASTTTGYFYDLHADEANGWVYYIDWLAEANTFNLLRKVPVNGGTPTTVYVAENNLYSVTMYQSATLPVTWASADAVLVNGKTELRWTTASEQHTKDFIVQHSTDGQRWKDVGVVAAAGHSVTTRSYTFVHPQPSIGLNYYRLKQRDLDGRYTYSKTMKLEWKIAEGKIYPNPLTGAQATILLPKEEIVSIFSTSGVKVWEKKLTAGSHSVSFTGIVAGVYIVHMGSSGKHTLLIQ
jgi:hypothetical protein